MREQFLLVCNGHFIDETVKKRLKVKVQCWELNFLFRSKKSSRKCQDRDGSDLWVSKSKIKSIVSFYFRVYIGCLVLHLIAVVVTTSVTA